MSEFFDDASDQQQIQEMLDKIYPVLNDPKGSFYLPSFVKSNGYDPYNLTGPPWTWNLTDANSLASAGVICTDVALNDTTYPCASDNDQYIRDPGVSVSLLLSAISVVGLSNIYTERPTVAADGVTITQVVDFSTLGPPASTAVTISGNFALTLNCCCSTDGKTCLPSTSTPQQGTGTFVATIPALGQGQAGSSCTVVFVITDIAPNILNLQAKSVNYSIPNTSKGVPNITIAINITSAGEQQQYNNLAESAFNSATGIQNVIANVNGVLNTASALTQFSTIVTNEIDGYLKQQHLYPFNNPSLALY